LLSFSEASGKRCKKAPPIKAPADREIRKRRNFDRVFSLIERVKTPIKEARLIRKVEAIIYISLSI